MTGGVAGRLAARALRPLGRVRCRRLVRAVTASIREDVEVPASTEPVRDLVTIVSTYRLTNDDRLRMLTATVAHLGRSLAGTGIRVIVADASDAEMAARSEAVWRASGLEVSYHRRDESMLVALEWLLGEVDTPFFLLQFDDMFEGGIDEGYLRGACDLLRRHAGKLGVTCPFWATAVTVHGEERVIEVVSHERRHGTVRLRGTGWLRPTATEVHAGRTFAVLENFTYGFFFNVLVAPVDDYLRRLHWYAERLGTTSVHAIEVAAAAKLLGPWWTHIGIALDRSALLDVDFAHTDAAVRSVIEGTGELADAVVAGWPIDIHVVEVG